MKTAHPPTEHGAITLLVAISLVVLAALASFYSSRSVLMDQLAAHNHARATQARLAAEAALASAQAAVVGGSASFDDLLSQPTPCPLGVKGPQWQCTSLMVPPHPALPQAQASVTAVRDLVMAPHVLTLHAQSSFTGQNSRGLVRESLFLPVLAPAPGDAPQAALVLNGCVSEAAGASLRVCPLSKNGQACSGTASAPVVQTHFVVDTNRNGSISTAEKTACMALSSISLPGGGTRSGPNSTVPRSPCNRAAWRSVFGDITAAQLQAWSQAQERSGLTASTRPARSIWWIDSPADWTQSLGSAEAPVLLVFSSLACAVRCPRMAAGTRIVGTVYLDAGCNDQRMRRWQAGQIEGQLVVEAGWPDIDANSRIWARSTASQAFRLAWPEGQDSRRVLPQPGSLWEGP